MLNYLTASGKSGDPSVLFQAKPAGDLELWGSNVKVNIERNLSLVRPDAAERGSDVMKLVCFGPSLEDNWEHLLVDEGDIWTISGANRYLYQKGIKPRFHIEADPREHKAKLLAGSCPETIYLIASRCHPAMFEVLKDKKVLMFHMDGGEESVLIEALCPGEFRVPPAWTMGNTALNVGLLLGYRSFLIYGMDGCFTEEGKQHPGEHPNEYPVMQKFTIDDGREFLSHPSHVVAAECFIKVMQHHPYGTFKFVGDGLIPWTYRCYTKNYHENQPPCD